MARTTLFAIALVTSVCFITACQTGSPDRVSRHMRYGHDGDGRAHRSASGEDRTEGHPKKSHNTSWIIPAAIVGAIAIAAIGSALASNRGTTPDDLTPRLIDTGPEFAPQFNMSAFAMHGLVKGGWPMVVDFEQRTRGFVHLRISAPDSEVVTFRLDNLGLGRHVVRFTLPADTLGDQLKPALIAVTASTDAEGKDTIGPFQVYGLGVGPKAVGSVAINAVSFGPPDIRATSGKTASYSFFSLSNFTKVSVEFMKVDEAQDGSRFSYVRNQLIAGGVRERQWVGKGEPRNWDGEDDKGQVSLGFHKLRVRVWDERGDWVAAWSDAKVYVEL